MLKRLLQIWLASRIRSIPTQTDLITYVTVKRFYRILIGHHSSEFLKIVDILLSGYGCIEMDSNTLLIKFVMGRKIKFSVQFLEPALTPAASCSSKKKFGKKTIINH